MALLLILSVPVHAQETSSLDVGVPSVELDGYERPLGLDVLHYDIALELPESGAEIRGRTTILFENFLPVRLQQLELDFGPMTVDSVSVDGRVVEFVHEAEVLRIEDFPRAQRGHRVPVTVWYHGTPADGLIIQDNRHGNRSVFADNWPDRSRYWFPGIDHPSDKATVVFDVTAPSEWQVVANGHLESVAAAGEGRSRTRWRETSQIPTYTMVIGATSFAVDSVGAYDGIEVTHWTYPEDAGDGAAMFSRSIEILAFYDSLFGPYPFEKLAHVQSSTRYGGMENSSAIFYSETTVGEALENGAGSPGDAADALTSLVAHETVHQWFGDAVTEKDWHHLWLSEGFATYFAAVFFEFHGSSRGGGPIELARRMHDAAVDVAAFYDQQPEAIIDERRREYEALLTPNNYEKGAWVLHMLRREIGDEAFFEAVRAFYGELRGGTAWTADFERVVETASDRDLGWFFSQWLGRPGMPALEVERTGSGLAVRQVQPGEAYRLSFDLEVDASGEKVRIPVRMENKVVEIEDVPPGSVRIDPDGWLLFTTDDGVRGTG